MFEDLEGIAQPVKQPIEVFTDAQLGYLAELDFSDSDWANVGDAQQLFTFSHIDRRMDELGIPLEERSEVAYRAFSVDLASDYEDYLVEQYDSAVDVEYGKEDLEAPQDHIQIEQISETISNCEEIKYENWISLELSEKESVLNSLEQRIAEIECRPACPIRLLPLEERQWGGYNPVTKDITINSNYAELSDYHTYKEVVDTLVHEGRHAYQDYNVNICEIHPRHSEVASWAETMEGGKWGYWGDCSTLLGQRLYDQQSIEIDARNFARDVLDKLNLNA